MNELFVRLGVSPDASADEIKRAYKKRALESHPDKGGDPEEMKRINEAYDILSDKEKCRKWEAEHPNDDEDADGSSVFLDSFGERPSESFRRYLQCMANLFSEHPLTPISPEARPTAYTDLNSPYMTQVLSSNYYNHLYRVKQDGIEYEDVFQFVLHKTKWSEEDAAISLSFFKGILTFEKGIEILRAFLEGKYYGKNLMLVKNYLQGQIANLYQNSPEILFHNAIVTILSNENLAENHQNILLSIENIYESIYEGRYTQHPKVIQLIQDKHFRYLIAGTLKYYWQSAEFKGPKQTLLEMKSKFTHLRKLFPMSKTHLRVEKQLEKVFSVSSPVKEIYECAYILIDLMQTCVTSASSANSAFMAALCFHYASKMEVEPAKAMSAECLALSLYQAAIGRGFNANVIIALYISTQAIKCLGNLKYDQSTLTPTQIKQFLTQPGDAKLLNFSGSVLTTVKGTIKRALYLVDIAPFYASPKSSVDLEIIEIFQIGMLRASLQNILSQNSIENFENAKVVYHAYELALQDWCEKEKENEHNEKKITLKMQSIEKLLESSGSEVFELSKMVDVPYIHMQRDAEGWLEPINFLDFPEKAGITIYRSFDGYEINTKTYEIKFRTQEWKQGDADCLKLFTEYDIYQMMALSICGGFLSLDHPDSNKRYHPLQSVRFAPENIEGTEYLKTLFMTDYLLKMFTTGVEIAGRPPYAVRSIEKLIERLPDLLRDRLNLCSKGSTGHQIHRFWITAEDIERQESKNKSHSIVHYGNIRMSVKKHLLDFDEAGNLKDAKIDENDDSKEAQFAREFTNFYDEIGTYFPEFLRLKEIVKIAGAMLELRNIRNNNNAKIAGFKLLLADEAHWKTTLTAKIAEKNKLLSEGYNSNLSAGFRQLGLHPTTDTTWWNTQYNATYQQKLSFLQSAVAAFPKFAYQLHDVKVTQVYNELYNENSNRIYNELYQTNKDNIIAQHGIAVWNREESKIAQQLRAHVTQTLTQGLSQQQVLNQLNNSAAQARLQCRQSYYNNLAELKTSIGDATYPRLIDEFMNGNCANLAAALTKYDIDHKKSVYNSVRADHYKIFISLKESLGEVKYSECIDQFLQGNISPLALALAENEINTTKIYLNSKVIKFQKLENKFQSLQFGAGKSENSQDATYQVPAVFYQDSEGNSSRHVYGGVSAFPSFMEVNRLSMDLMSSFKSIKESAIRAAESFLSKTKYAAGASLLMGSAYAQSYFEVKSLEMNVQQAKSELFWLEQKERHEINMRFQANNQMLLSRILVDINPAKTPHNFFLHDPFMVFRFEDDYTRQKNSMNVLRKTIEPSVETALRYTQATWTGACQGANDIKNLIAHPWEGFVKPLGVLLWDSVVLGIAHFPLIAVPHSSEDGYIEYLTLKHLIGNNLSIYNYSLANMQLRVKNIRDAADNYFAAENEEQVRMCTRATINMLLPGVVIKSAKFLASKHPKFSPKPIIFDNLDPHDRVLASANSLKLLTPTDIRKIKPYANLEWAELMEMAKTTTDPHTAAIFNPNVVNMIYVIVLKEGGKKELRIARQDAVKVKNSAGEIFLDEIIHPDVAGNGKVIGAGNLFVEEGQVIRINEFSGHYVPDGTHLKSLSEQVFVEFGLPESKGKFIYDFHDMTKMAPSKTVPGSLEYINPAHISIGIGGGIVARKTDPDRKNQPK